MPTAEWRGRPRGRTFGALSVATVALGLALGGVLSACRPPPAPTARVDAGAVRAEVVTTARHPASPTTSTTAPAPPARPVVAVAAPPPVTVPPAVPVPPPPPAVTTRCADALAYLAAHQAPGFVATCAPGSALGHDGVTCWNVAGMCADGARIIRIACPAPFVYMNEAHNSWSLTGAGSGIDPYGQGTPAERAFCDRLR